MFDLNIYYSCLSKVLLGERRNEIPKFLRDIVIPQEIDPSQWFDDVCYCYVVRMVELFVKTLYSLDCVLTIPIYSDVPVDEFFHELEMRNSFIYSIFDSKKSANIREDVDDFNNQWYTGDHIIYDIVHLTMDYDTIPEIQCCEFVDNIDCLKILRNHDRDLYCGEESDCRQHYYCFDEKMDSYRENIEEADMGLGYDNRSKEKSFRYYYKGFRYKRFCEFDYHNRRYIKRRKLNSELHPHAVKFKLKGGSNRRNENKQNRRVVIRDPTREDYRYIDRNKDIVTIVNYNSVHFNKSRPKEKVLIFSIAINDLNNVDDSNSPLSGFLDGLSKYRRSIVISCDYTLQLVNNENHSIMTNIFLSDRDYSKENLRPDECMEKGELPLSKQIFISRGAFNKISTSSKIDISKYFGRKSSYDQEEGNYMYGESSPKLRYFLNFSFFGSNDFTDEGISYSLYMRFRTKWFDIRDET